MGWFISALLLEHIFSEVSPPDDNVSMLTDKSILIPTTPPASSVVVPEPSAQRRFQVDDQVTTTEFQSDIHVSL